MVKIVGPMHSDDARGKFADSIVFMGWKGIKDARMWLKPANPQVAAQGDIRCIIGGLGRAAGKVKKGSAYDTQLQTLGAVPAQQSKQSFLVKYMKDVFITGSGTTMKSNYDAMLAELQGHTAYDDWKTAAAGIGLSDFSLPYDSIDPFEKALGLYLLAKAAITLSFSGTPYSTALASWTSTEIADFVADLQGA